MAGRMPETPPAAAPATAARTRRGWVVGAVMLAMLLASLDMTIVGTAMPSIVADLKGLSIYSWVFSAYLLTSTTPIPIYARLADMYGRKRLFLIGVGVFLLGSGLSATSRNMPELIAFRALQGVGAAGVLPVALTIVGDLFSLEQRARIQGLFSAVWGLSAVLGPLLGAVIVEHTSWRWVFGINLPVGLLVLAIVSRSFHERLAPRPHRIDWTGTVWLTFAVSLLLLGLVESGPGAVTAIVAALVLLAGFGWWERRAAEPVLPLYLLGERFLGLTNALNLAAGMVMFALISYLPLYVQGARGLPPMAAGQAITPMMVGWPLAATVAAPLLLRVGYRPVTVLGGVLIAGGYALAVSRLAGSGLYAGMFLLGTGLGFTMTTLLVVAQSAVPWDRRGTVTGAMSFFRTIGGAVGVAVAGALLNRGLARGAAGLPLPPHTRVSTLVGALTAPTGAPALPAAVDDALRQLLARTLAGIFHAGLGLAALALILTLLLPAAPAGPDA
ncbi:MFS transporter [Candidatus Hydrogenisulfobacillus filiaventi]|uniref:MFS transporter n=1 Tax=Candidatus Hydrogenisulfobacillus filiaventi TaxID=2707344 RepID=A0A6F8ZFB4_9FIRM|nr:MDR family MFS transporter [Bacillota bacterium]CAB1128624.1 MFS transporter [Candidatus Hydrogenisulfobacillus filiaventi]